MENRFVQTQATEWVSLDGQVIIRYYNFGAEGSSYFVIYTWDNERITRVTKPYVRNIVRLLRAMSFGAPDFSACIGLPVDD